jgi:hypothetical protein
MAHADELETSIYLAIDPDAVDMSKAVDEQGYPAGENARLEWWADGPLRVVAAVAGLAVAAVAAVALRPETRAAFHDWLKDPRVWIGSVGLLLVGLVAWALLGAVSYDFSAPWNAEERTVQVDYRSFYQERLGPENAGLLTLVIVGAGLLVWRDRSDVALLLLGLLVGHLAGLALRVPYPGMRYLVLLDPLFIVLAATGVALAVPAPSRQFRVRALAAHALMGGLLVAAVFMSPATLTFTQPSADLGDEAPRPNFSLAYGAILREADHDACIISAWPAGDLVFMDHSDGWLAHDVDGRGIAGWITNDGRDVVAGAPALYSPEEAAAIGPDEDSCYAVVHAQAFPRLSPDMQQYVESLEWMPEGSDGTIAVWRRPASSDP